MDIEEKSQSNSSSSSSSSSPPLDRITKSQNPYINKNKIIKKGGVRKTTFKETSRPVYGRKSHTGGKCATSAATHNHDIEASRNVVGSVSSSSSSSFVNACEIISISSIRVLQEFVDEEAMFNMPVLLDSMAEGLILTPLAMKKGFNWSSFYDQVDDDGIELNLWGD